MDEAIHPAATACPALGRPGVFETPAEVAALRHPYQASAKVL
jgi:hypothetical protein